MALGRNYYQMQWREVETATALDLKVLWGWDGSTADPSDHGLEMDQDDIWYLYMVRRLDGFKENAYVLRLLQVQQRGTWWQMGPDRWRGQMVEVERIRSGIYSYSIC